MSGNPRPKPTQMARGGHLSFHRAGLALAPGRWPGPLAGSPGHRGRAVAQYGRVWPRPSASGQQAGYARAAPRVRCR